MRAGARPACSRSSPSGIAWGLVMHSMGWAQLSNYAQVRALADGRAEIDRWQWETKDKAWVDGHFYSVKAPGLAALTLPAYLALDAAGAKTVARDAAANAAAGRPPAVGPARAARPRASTASAPLVPTGSRSGSSTRRRSSGR